MLSNVDRLRFFAALGVLTVVGALAGHYTGPRAVNVVAERRHLIEQRRNISESWSSIVGTRSTIGDSMIGVTVVEFTDYQCQLCRQVDRAIDSLILQGGIRVEYRQLPATHIHPAAEGAARAAICAEAQGRFAAMHAYLMRTLAWQADTNWLIAARGSGVHDENGFRACLHSASTTDRLNRDLGLAKRLRVRGTPTFVTRHRLYGGVAGVQRIAADLKKSRWKQATVGDVVGYRPHSDSMIGRFK